MKLLFFSFVFLAAWTVTRAGELWPDPLSMYRVEIKLAQPAQGEIEVGVPVKDLLTALGKVSPEAMDERDFAFEKVILTDAATGQTVGRYELEVAPENLLVNGELEVVNGALAGWPGFDPATMEARTESIGPERRNALFITKESISNSRLAQSVRLKPQGWYLFRHWQWRDGSDNPLVIQAIDPSKRLFRRDFSSYVPLYLPPAQWEENVELIHPRQALVDIEISTAFAGRQGAAAVTLQSARWVLRARLSKSTQKLHLFVVGRAGHILPEARGIPLTGKVLPVVAASAGAAESRFREEVEVLAEDEAFQLWTIPGSFPLREDFLAGLTPVAGRTPAAKLRLKTFRNGWVSVPIVVNSGTPLLDIRKATAKAPFPVKVEKLGLIPIFDGPFPSGHWLENRFDALMPVRDREFTPPRLGQHVLIVTCHVPAAAAAGVHQGTLELELGHQKGVRKTYAIKLEIEVADIVLRPQRHFFTIFGNEQWMTRISSDLSTQPVGAVDFHGLTPERLSENPEDPNDRNPRLSRLGRITRAYNHTLLDCWLSPQSPSLFVPFSYSVVEAGEGKAPRLENFQFQHFDEALKEFVIERDMPWFSIHHTNGHLMDSLTLQNGVTYTMKDVEETPHLKHLPEDEFLRLMGDYIEAPAAHLQDMGLLDRALLTIDESSPPTYPLMLKIRRELQSRPLTREIKFFHTAQNTAWLTQKKNDGKPIMAEVLDFPAPQNDDHFSFLMPDLAWKAEKPGGAMWVYYVQTAHWSLLHSGLSTVVAPLKLTHFGVQGWYCWSAFLWSLPYEKKGPEEDGVRFTSGPVINPWLNSFYHHGPGVLSFFYPPDPQGIPDQPIEKVVPSYRLYLMRDGLQDVAWQKVLRKGVDDDGRKLAVAPSTVEESVHLMNLLWADNPTQWYLGYHAYLAAVQKMRDALK